jgi:hypothetical protein
MPVLVSLWALSACAAATRTDDHDVGCLGHLFIREPITTRVGLFQVERAVDEGGFHLFFSRVVEPIRGLARGERIVFYQPIRPATPAMHLPEHEGGFAPAAPEYPPRLEAGEEYLLFLTPQDTFYDDEVGPIVRALGHPDAFLYLSTTPVVNTRKRGIRDILPQIKEYVHASCLPDDQKPAALRRWAFANLDPRNAFLRHVLHEELAWSRWCYPGASKEEATRLAQYSDIVGGLERFKILEKLALHTDHPMDFWFLRALSRGAPGRIDPENLPTVMTFHDSILGAAPKLSIDSFWPMLDRRTPTMSMWVEAFAVKADPRLLPIILRHVTPEDWSGVQALGYYKGSQAATRAILDLVRKTNDFRQEDKYREGSAQIAVSNVLKRIGTPEALAQAGRLDPLARPPGTDPPEPVVDPKRPRIDRNDPSTYGTQFIDPPGKPFRRGK